MDFLRQFNSESTNKALLLGYLVSFFESKIIERAMKKESVESLADAIIELKSGFEQLEIDYGIKPKEKEYTNGAR